MKEQIHLLTLVFNFLDNLSEEQLQLLLTHKVDLKLNDASLKLNDVSSKKKKSLKNETNLSQEDITEFYNNIEKCSTEEEALKFIKDLKLKNNDLKAIAKQFNIRITSKDTKSQLIDKIIESSIGAKLKYDALLNVNLD